MRKYTHPFLKETLIQCKDGSVYMKNWLYFRSFLPLEIDFTTNKIWKKTNLNKIETNKKEIFDLNINKKIK